MKVALLGDISLNGRYDITINPNALTSIKYLNEILNDCDYVIANLESPLTTKKTTLSCKGAYLRSNPKSVQILNAIGVTHVSLANNHIFDYGIQGANETIQTLKNSKINYVGLNNGPCLLEKHNNKILLEGFCCYSANGLKYGKSNNSIKRLNTQEIEKFFECAKLTNALPIASVHFGIEDVHHPSVEHRNFFRKFANKYTYILHGNHPHAIQGYEKVNNSYLFYACGDLCFDTVTETSTNQNAVQTDESRQSYIVKISVENNECINTEIVTVSDLPDGIIKINNTIFNDLKRYNANLKLNDEHLKALRQKEINQNYSTSQNHNLRFFLNRLNFKYIFAFLNGKLHSIIYRQIMKKFF